MAPCAPLSYASAHYHLNLIIRHEQSLFSAVYTGWPRKSATTLIVHFKDIINKTELFFFFGGGGEFIFQQMTP